MLEVVVQGYYAVILSLSKDEAKNYEPNSIATI
jgi:hypothetical protein